MKFLLLLQNLIDCLAKLGNVALAQQDVLHPHNVFPSVRITFDDCFQSIESDSDQLGERGDLAPTLLLDDTVDGARKILGGHQGLTIGRVVGLS
jgi:hypothetical protein